MNDERGEEKTKSKRAHYLALNRGMLSRIPNAWNLLGRDRATIFPGIRWQGARGDRRAHGGRARRGRTALRAPRLGWARGRALAGGLCRSRWNLAWRIDGF